VHDCPTIALGRALYDLPGLTFQGTLDDFWRKIEAPDKSLFRDFRNVVIHTTQINGGFYCRQGMDMAVRNAIPVMTDSDSPLEKLAKRH
jgi:capsular polysaccharide export protein